MIYTIDLLHSINWEVLQKSLFSQSILLNHAFQYMIYKYKHIYKLIYKTNFPNFFQCRGKNYGSVFKVNALDCFPIINKVLSLVVR